ncbi:hypothetical protein Rxycam_02996 [Rubrobacter xylanophilus DSM 9941]|uniref:RNA polymerase sigma factor n=1 Tax=Rubrobacter xylanophilus TaxID=49319 RepID=UPI001C63EEC8|nr:sigma-70 family RNA polymerase sigma factor [Rubrobacter xylanophilus]QYJ17157.1 hypothetical protein Rxycam_02996 [Rubrobacter xylanophilus DSM 9941]
MAELAFRTVVPPLVRCGAVEAMLSLAVARRRRRSSKQESRRAPDEELVRRIAASGDTRALAELYDRYGGLVYALGLRLLGDRPLAEELVQDVFVAVWRNAASFDPSRAGFSTWVYRIARNRITDLDRRRRARPRPAEGEGVERAVGDAAGALPEALDVAEALSRLTPEHREVLVLAYFRGLTQREISEATGLPLGTVKSRTSAALKSLRRELEGRE